MNNILHKIVLTVVLPACFSNCLIHSQSTFGTEQFISYEKVKGAFTISASGKSTPLLISSKEWPGVKRAFRDLKTDIGKVTSSVPELSYDTIPHSKEIIIAGTIGKSELIDNLIRNKKIVTDSITGKWEAFLIQVVKKPFKGVKKALVIAGRDKRGTIYGIYEVSKQIGVSPWYWWADVPVARKENLFFRPVSYIDGSPSVKYRGIFLNDEAPDLTNWIRAKYGYVTQSDNPPVPPGVANYGHEFYTKLFELLLRLKANYLWPAMWNNAFNEDDPENPRLADEYGIVMGNSHQEPMLRAQKEWDRRYQRKIGSWNYAKNPDILESFWREGIRRNSKYESIITIGLRGANDTPMVSGGPEANMALPERIVNVQRNIIVEEINPDIAKVPQLWCLYKEVQDYYKAGMRIPDDVTLLWAEDNWGNVRRLPTAEEAAEIVSLYTKYNGRRKPELLSPFTYSLVNYYEAEMGVSVEGSEAVWPGERTSPVLPEFDVFNKKTHYIEVFNKGAGSMDFSASADKQWINVSTGTFDVTTVLAPTLNYIRDRGLTYGISFGDQPPQIVTLVPENHDARNGNTDWEKTVSDNARLSKTNHTILVPGYHTLKIWLIDPGIVLQKIIVNTGGLRQSYLGPPESYKGK